MCVAVGFGWNRWRYVKCGFLHNLGVKDDRPEQGERARESIILRQSKPRGKCHFYLEVGVEDPSPAGRFRSWIIPETGKKILQIGNACGWKSEPRGAA